MGLRRLWDLSRTSSTSLWQPPQHFPQKGGSAKPAIPQIHQLLALHDFLRRSVSVWHDFPGIYSEEWIRCLHGIDVEFVSFHSAVLCVRRWLIWRLPGTGAKSC